MEPKQVDGNLKISVRRTENGEIVRHTIPRNMEYEDWEQMTPVTLTHSFEWGRDPDCKSDDWSRCFLWLQKTKGNRIGEFRWEL